MNGCKIELDAWKQEKRDAEKVLASDDANRNTKIYMKRALLNADAAIKAYEEIIKEKEAKKTKKTTGDKEFDPKNPYQVHAVNYLLGTPGGWTMKTAEKYVANLPKKELERLAHYDM